MRSVAPFVKVGQGLHLVDYSHWTAKPHTVNNASNDLCGSCREFILYLPISAENPDPRLHIRAQYAETSQCSECGQQHGQRKCLQGRPTTWYVTYTSGISHFWMQNKQTNAYGDTYSSRGAPYITTTVWKKRHDSRKYRQDLDNLLICEWNNKLNYIKWLWNQNWQLLLFMKYCSAMTSLLWCVFMHEEGRTSSLT